MGRGGVGRGGVGRGGVGRGIEVKYFQVGQMSL